MQRLKKFKIILQINKRMKKRLKKRLKNFKKSVLIFKIKMAYLNINQNFMWIPVWNLIYRMKKKTKMSYNNKNKWFKKFKFNRMKLKIGLKKFKIISMNYKINKILLWSHYYIIRVRNNT